MGHLVPWEGAVAGHKLPRGNNANAYSTRGPAMPGALTTAEQDPSRAARRPWSGRARAAATDVVQLYRQDAPPAWRLGLALTGRRRRPPPTRWPGLPPHAGRRCGPAHARSGTPFRLRLLTATRQAALDGPARGARPLTRARPPPAAEPRRRGARRSPRAARPVMAAFGKLPERWRTILWLLVVEGLGTGSAQPRARRDRPEEAEDSPTAPRPGCASRWPAAHAGSATAPAASAPRRRLQPVRRRSLAELRRQPGRARHLDRCEDCRSRPTVDDPAPACAARAERSLSRRHSPRRRWLAARRGRRPDPSGCACPAARRARVGRATLAGATAAMVTLGITAAVAHGASTTAPTTPDA